MHDPIREAIKDAFPEWTQQFWTSLTGKPYDGQQEFRVSKWFVLINNFLCLPVGLLLTTLGMQSIELMWLLPVAWFMTVHGRVGLKNVMHGCAHDVFFRFKKDNILLGELVSITINAEPFKEYQQKHTQDHHSPRMLTEEEQSYKDWFIFLGMELGVSTNELKRRLYSKVLSPLHYIKVFVKRMRSVFGSSYPERTLQATLIWGLVLAVFIANSWWPYLLVWWVPSFIMHEFCLFFLLSTEHVWLDPNITETDPRKQHQYMTVAVFHGDMPPQTTATSLNGMKAWFVWWLRVLFFHIPVRLLVMAGDLVAHDQHHRSPTERDWPNAMWLREKYEPKGLNNSPLRCIWGLDRALDNYFLSIERGKPRQIIPVSSKTREPLSLSLDTELTAH